MSRKKIHTMRMHYRMLAFLMTLAIFLVLGALPAIFFGGGFETLRENSGYFIWYIVYWNFISALFFSLVTYQHKKDYEIPLGKLGVAAGKVAKGDFSVYLKPMRTPNHYDYVDYLFEDFNLMVKELGSIETLKSDFIRNISHEIKTPLSVIQNYATMLQSDDLEPDQRIVYAGTIVAASERLSELVGNILRLSKLENQSIQPEKEVYDLTRQLSDCAIAQEKEINAKMLEFSLVMDERVQVCQDRSLLDIVWQNLLSNAIRYTGAHGKVEICVKKRPDAVLVSISDTGCGIAATALPHIFDKFYQENRGGNGNGLGLAMVAKALQLAKCKIEVESEKDKGSVFTVILPKNENSNNTATK